MSVPIVMFTNSVLNISRAQCCMISVESTTLSKNDDTRHTYDSHHQQQLIIVFSQPYFTDTNRIEMTKN